MSELSLATQAIREAVDAVFALSSAPPTTEEVAAAVLHAVADQVVPTEPDYMRDAIPDAYDQREATRRQILAIAAELEGRHG